MKWNQNDGEGWKQTIYPGHNIIGIGQSPDYNTHSVHYAYQKHRLDYLYEYSGSYNLSCCTDKMPQNYFTLLCPQLDKFYRLPEFEHDFPVKKYRGSVFKVWNIRRKWRSGNDHPEYFVTSKPPEMWWCLNVEGFMNSHFLSTYYHMDVGCELEFIEPTTAHRGASGLPGVLNRTCAVFNTGGMTDCDGTPLLGWDLVQPQSYTYATKESYWNKWGTDQLGVGEYAPVLYSWPPDGSNEAEPIVNSLKHCTFEGRPLGPVRDVNGDFDIEDPFGLGSASGVVGDEMVVPEDCHPLLVWSMMSPPPVLFC